jgi:hypothetical protein
VVLAAAVAAGTLDELVASFFGGSEQALVILK